ncbi:DNA methyltransferase [Fontivita pretiosa]|uniref:DNA methyltransferase n=1 Tax=Fontivita pretiosa TaxID=2989684 RepID=UPI003D177569
MTTEGVAGLIAGVHDRQRISGLTHGFYRYPARFSPRFARAAIEAFTKPGDLVFDPFMGGATSLVEAAAHGRQAVGTDINSLSVFVAQVKTTTLSDDELKQVKLWVDTIANELNMHCETERDVAWAERGYHRNISCRRTWPIRKSLEMALARVGLLKTVYQQRFARCVLLRTGQWALDCRKHIPSARAFRRQLRRHVEDMVVGARQFSDAISATCEKPRRECALCLHRSAAGVEHEPALKELPAPRLVLTSPPYPGVHVLYHRWQVQGRRETPAPYWIASSLDGDGSSYYTFGDRHQPGLADYFASALAAFKSVAAMATKRTQIVQLVAFSDPSWQLPLYLETMERAGLVEHKYSALANADDGRLWRSVPNRKFYADRKGTTSSKEVVLFHRPL